jgi:hypothetical protein
MPRPTPGDHPEPAWLSEAGVPVDPDWARALGVPEVPAAARALALGKLAFVHRQNQWVSVPLDAHWVAAYRITVQDGAVVVGEVRVFPREEDRWSLPGTWSAEVLGIKAPVPRGGITSRLLRRVRVGAHHRIADAVLRRDADWVPMPLALERQRPPGAGRPRKPDLWYARLAQAYARALHAGSARPILDVARAKHLPPARVRDAIYRARGRGLLSRAQLPGQEGQQGQKGGRLTPKALALLGMEEPGRAVRGARKAAKRTWRSAGRRKER